MIGIYEDNDKNSYDKTSCGKDVIFMQLESNEIIMKHNGIRNERRRMISMKKTMLQQP